jgi:hypothetical protein
MPYVNGLTKKEKDKLIYLYKVTLGFKICKCRKEKRKSKNGKVLYEVYYT